MKITKLTSFMLLAFIFLQTSCASKSVPNSQIYAENRSSLDNIFTYYNSENNVQFTALISGKFISKDNCLLLVDEESVVTPVFNSNDVKFDPETRSISLNGVTIQLNEEVLLGGGFINKEDLPNLDTRGNDKCLTDRVALLHSFVELTPDMRKRWLLPPKT